MTATSPTSPLVFNETRHEYRLNGLWVPGATRILSDCGYTPNSQFFSPQSRIRGQQVHLAIQYASQYAPEAETVEEVEEVVAIGDAIRPYLAGFLLARRELGFKPILTESLVWSVNSMTAGKIDSLALMRSGQRAIVDYKTWLSQGSKPKRSAEIQLGGYKCMAEESLGEKVDCRISLKLPGDGGYRSYMCKNPTDEMVWRALCIVWWDRKKAGLLDGNGESEVEQEAI